MPTNPVDIKAELLAATKLKQTKGEEPSAFAERVVRAASAFEDSVWEKLSNEAQLWVNAGVEAIEKKTAVQVLPELQGEDEPEAAAEPAQTAAAGEDPDAEEPAQSPANTKGSAMAKQKKVTAAAAAEPAEAATKGKKNGAAKSAAPAKPKGESAVTAIRKVIIKKPNATSEQIKASIAAKHPDISDGTINTTRAGTRAVLALLPEYQERIRGE